MILMVSGRTDIVAFYSKWFLNRYKEGFIDVRNPFNPKLVSRINFEDVDLIMFCTKNPIPIIKNLKDIKKPILFHITLTPYKKDIEPNIPPKGLIINSIKEVSKILGKEYVTVLDFIGNDYKRSVQIAFALGGLAENFVVEKQLVAALIADNFKSIGLEKYGVEIHIDDLSKKEILSYIDEVNFNTKVYLQQDYANFKKYISASRYPSHVDYINNDYAPDLLKFLQSRIGGTKNKSYYGFL